MKAGPVGDAEGAHFRLYAFDTKTRLPKYVMDLPTKVRDAAFHPESLTRNGENLVLFGDSTLWPPLTYSVKAPTV